MKKLLTPSLPHHSLNSLNSIHSFALLALLALPFFTACTDEESDLGIDLIDSTTLYQGICDTLYVDNAWTELEDSLNTSNPNLSDNLFSFRTTSISVNI